MHYNLESWGLVSTLCAIWKQGSQKCISFYNFYVTVSYEASCSRHLAFNNMWAWLYPTWLNPGRRSASCLISISYWTNSLGENYVGRKMLHGPEIIPFNHSSDFPHIVFFPKKPWYWAGWNHQDHTDQYCFMAPPTVLWDISQSSFTPLERENMLFPMVSFSSLFDFRTTYFPLPLIPLVADF